jgi:exosortase/archaeosortase family protein
MRTKFNNKELKKIIGLFARYLFILALGIGNLYLIYKIFTPITFFILNKTLFIFANAHFSQGIFYFQNFNIELVQACIAGSAFFLLIFLIFSTANIKPKKRILMLITSISILLLLNYARIVFLILIANSIYFEIIHWVLWNLVSILLVVATWFLVAKIYKINSIPVYSDIKFLLDNIKIKH